MVVSYLHSGVKLPRIGRLGGTPGWKLLPEGPNGRQIEHEGATLGSGTAQSMLKSFKDVIDFPKLLYREFDMCSSCVLTR